MENILFGMKELELRLLASDFAVRNYILHPFNDGMAGKIWFSGFIKSHPQLRLRAPEQTSTAGAGAFNQQTVSKFSYMLGDLHLKHSFRPS
jgi:hypothetical protein